ncbi:MAG: glycosyltransferase [Candidatus Cloacimonetes bacterium]|jgi:hypothetical protein|nr:glycosyltransferase [Candidatus Cloacimonadota bacterium]
MKILLCNPPGGAFTFITQGMINALRDIGCVAERWDGKKGSWYSFDPDLYIGCSGHRQDIPRDRRCKIALHVNPYGPKRIEPNINESQDAINWVSSIRPDAVFGYGHETDRHYWSFWDRDGMPWVPLATAGDATIFKTSNGTHDKYDIGYVGGRWPYKAKDIDAYLLPVLRDRTISHKVCGWGTWPENLCNGIIADNEVPILLANCKIAPCISEPHTITSGIDLPERVFKVILSGAVAVHDPAFDISRYLPTSAIWAETPNGYHAKIKDLLRLDANALKEIARKQHKDVLSAHTYHHRMATLLFVLGFDDIATKLLTEIASERFNTR